MPIYRAYLINGNNRVSSFRAIDAEFDAEALNAARQFAGRCDVEVWDLDRKIGRLEGKRVRLGHHKFEIIAKYRNDRPAMRFCPISFVEK